MTNLHTNPKRLEYADQVETQGQPLVAKYIRAEVGTSQHDIWTAAYWDHRDITRELRETSVVDDQLLEKLGLPRLTSNPLFTRKPSSRSELWRTLERFFEYWMPSAIDRNSGMPQSEIELKEQQLGIKLPAALREWYLWAGATHRSWLGSWRPIPLDQLRIEETNRLVVFSGIYADVFVDLNDLGESDPTTFYLINDRRDPEPIIHKGSTLTKLFAAYALSAAFAWGKVNCLGVGYLDVVKFGDTTFRRLSNESKRQLGSVGVKVDWLGDLWEGDGWLGSSDRGLVFQSVEAISRFDPPCYQLRLIKEAIVEFYERKKGPVPRASEK